MLLLIVLIIVLLVVVVLSLFKSEFIIIEKAKAAISTPLQEAQPEKTASWPV